MERETLVSIVIPTYKRYDLIERAIKSAINQTYKNIEIIVVDDNIKDSEERKKTEEIIKRYPDVKYYKNSENLGGSLTRNKGIELSNGEFIAFLDDDDEFYPNKIEKQLEYYYRLDNEKIAIIYCYVQDINQFGEKGKQCCKDYEGNALFEHMAYFIATTSTWLCKKEILENVGGFDDVPSQQDTTLLLKLLANGYEVYRVPEILLNFYQHSGKRITAKNYKYIEAVKNYNDKCRKYYDRLTKNQIKIVEHNFACKLFDLYYSLNDRNNCKEQIKMIFKENIFSPKGTKRLLKLLVMKG